MCGRMNDESETFLLTWAKDYAKRDFSHKIASKHEYTMNNTIKHNEHVKVVLRTVVFQ